MNKPNYCEPCKYQFKSSKELINHINTTHPTGSKSSNPSPVSTRVLMPEDQMLYYLNTSLTSREIYGVYKNKDTGELRIENHEVFMKLDHGMKELVTKAIEIANRRIK